MADNDSRDGYHPVQTTENNSQPNNPRQLDDEEKTSQDPDAILPQERCCCSALQRLASPYIFCFLMCLNSIFLGSAFYGVGGGILTTIEKRFQLKTSEMGPFFFANDLMSVVMVLFIAYYGHTSHRPRIIGAGTILIGLGNLLCTLPQFIYEPPPQFSLEKFRVENSTVDELPQYGQSLIYPMCQLTDNATEVEDTAICTEEEERSSGSLMWQVSWILVGQILAGLGVTPLSPLTITYLDDSMDKTSTSVAVACLFVAGSIGPLLGYAITSFCLTIHADFYKGHVYPQAGDPNWIGAWWLGFVINGLLITIIGIPLALFPKKIRRRAEETIKDQEEMKMKSQGVEGETEDEMEDEENMNVAAMYRLNVRKVGRGKCAYVKGFLGAIRRLVTNLTFMTLVLGGCFMITSLVGNLSFSAKYIETQFGLSAASTPLLSGFILTPGMLLGNLIGGFVIKKLRLGKKGMARMVVILKPVTIIFTCLLLFLGCQNGDIAGITSGYVAENMTGTSLPDLMAGCNDDCACPQEYTPICGSDGVTYATPCHAGCLVTIPAADGEGNTTIYTDCSCIGDSTQANPFGLSGDYEHVAIQGECPRECNTLVPFVVVAISTILLGSIIGIPAFMLEIRTVDEGDRSLAIGFSALLMRLLATIPAPIIFGAVIQTACLLLQSSCGKTGNCLVYDIVHFRYAFWGVNAGLETAALILLIVSYLSIRETEHPEALEEMTAMNETDAKQPSDPLTGTSKDGTTVAYEGTDM